MSVNRNAGKESSKDRVGSSVLDKIPFLHGCEDDDEDDSDEEDDFQGIATDCIDGPRKSKKSRVKVWPVKEHFHNPSALSVLCPEVNLSHVLCCLPPAQMSSEPMTTDLDPEDEEDEDDSEDALNEFDFLGSGEDGEGAGEARISGDGRELGTPLP